MNAFTLLFSIPQHPGQGGAGETVSQDPVAVREQGRREFTTSPADLVAALDLAVHVLQDCGAGGISRRQSRLTQGQGLWHDVMQIVRGGAGRQQTPSS